VWLSNDGRLRLELQGDNGDANLVVNNNSFWVSDPVQHTVYEGTLPADKSAHSSKAKASQHHIPTVADIQSELTRLMKQADVAGAGTSSPGDVAGRPAYSVSVSPKHSGGLLGQAQLAWDAANGVPLRFAIYARGNPSPVLALTATNISYGTVADSDLNITPPAGDKVVKVSTAGASGAQAGAAKAAKTKHAEVKGVAAVSSHVPFTLVAPKAVVGLKRQDVTLLDWGGKPAALLTYGQGLGGVAVVEQSEPAGAAASSGSSSSPGGLKLPSVSINGATGTELGTPLGTVIQFHRGGVSYTVLGSVAPYAAESAARALTPGP
jgi:hypothetical protein